MVVLCGWLAIAALSSTLMSVGGGDEPMDSGTSDTEERRKRGGELVGSIGQVRVALPAVVCVSALGGSSNRKK